MISLGALIVLGGIVLFVLFKSLNTPEPASLSGATSLAGAGPESISGTVVITKELESRVSEDAVLFVIARKGESGPPFAVIRIPQPRFPQPFRLGPENVMMTGNTFEGTVRLAARLSRSGAAGPAEPGDLEGEAPDFVSVGASNVTIAMSRVH